jgi:hypothetical protein
MVSDSAVLAPTQQSVKAYVDGFAARDYLHVRDEKASGTAGGTFTAGAWQTRTLNTQKTNTISGASIDTGTSVVTLPAGTYDVRARLPASRVNAHIARLYNITGAAVLVGGTTGNTNSSGAYAMDSSHVNGRFTLAGITTIRLEHYCANTIATNGWGIPANLASTTEVYAEMEIWKVA